EPVEGGRVVGTHHGERMDRGGGAAKLPARWVTLPGIPHESARRHPRAELLRETGEGSGREAQRFQAGIGEGHVYGPFGVPIPRRRRRHHLGRLADPCSALPSIMEAKEQVMCMVKPSSAEERGLNLVELEHPLDLLCTDATAVVESAPHGTLLVLDGCH